MACLWNISWMHGHARKRAHAKWRGWRITWICDSYNGMRDQMLNNIWPQDELRRGNAKTSKECLTKSPVCYKSLEPQNLNLHCIELFHLHGCKFHSVLYNFQILFPKKCLPVKFPVKLIGVFAICVWNLQAENNILELRNIYIHYRNIHEFKVL